MLQPLTSSKLRALAAMHQVRQLSAFVREARVHAYAGFRDGRACDLREWLRARHSPRSLYAALSGVTTANSLVMHLGKAKPTNVTQSRLTRLIS